MESVTKHEQVQADKYLFRETDNGLEILRGGEEWITSTDFVNTPGCNATLALFHEVLQLRAQLSSVTDKAVDVLNDIIKEAPELLKMSVSATPALLDHPNIVCAERPDGSCYLRVLGVVNGVLDAAGLVKVNAVVEDDLDTVLEFRRCKK